MDPFVKKVRTEAEKAALIAEAKKEWDRLDPSISHLVAPSEDHYLARVSAGIDVEREAFVPARELTAAELAKQNGELMFMQMFGDRADSRETGIPALDNLVAERERADFQKLLGPSQRAESALEGLIRSIVVKAIENPSVPRRASDRTGLGIIPRAAAASEGDDSAVARFLRAYVSGDVTTQRQIARSLAAA
jgi:hypothetical protein